MKFSNSLSLSSSNEVSPKGLNCKSCSKFWVSFNDYSRASSLLLPPIILTWSIWLSIALILFSKAFMSILETKLSPRLLSMSLRGVNFGVEIMDAWHPAPNEDLIGVIMPDYIALTYWPKASLCFLSSFFCLACNFFNFIISTKLKLAFSNISILLSFFKSWFMS